MDGALRPIIGDRGVCKSLFMAYLLHETYASGGIVSANYKLEFPYIHMPFNILAKSLGLAKCGCRNVQPQSFCQEHGNAPILQGAVIGTDEMGKGADSYEFWSEQAKDLADIGFQLRKLGAIWYFNVQRFVDIAARIRRLCDVFFLLEHVRIDTAYAMEHPELVDENLFSLDRPIAKSVKGYYFLKAMAEVTVCNDNLETLHSFRFNGRTYVHLYNTRQIIW